MWILHFLPDSIILPGMSLYKLPAEIAGVILVKWEEFIAKHILENYRTKYESKYNTA